MVPSPTHPAGLPWTLCLSAAALQLLLGGCVPEELCTQVLPGWHGPGACPHPGELLLPRALGESLGSSFLQVNELSLCTEVGGAARARSMLGAQEEQE